MADRAEFLFRDSRSLTGDRHPRPKILPSYGESRVVSALRPLVRFAPPGVDSADWRDAVSRTATMLLTVVDSNWLSMTQKKALRTDLDQAVAKAMADPDSAVEEMARLWDSVADRYRSPLKISRSGGDDRFARPKVLPLRD